LLGNSQGRAWVEESVDECLKRVEREEQQVRYRSEMRKRQQWDDEVERIRVEVAS